MTSAQNPLEQPFATVHQTPPFTRLTNASYEPAIDRGIALAKAEIEKIANNPEEPTFENTIVALERAARTSTACSTCSIRCCRPTPTTR